MPEFILSSFRGDGCGISRQVITAPNYDSAISRIANDPPGWIRSIDPVLKPKPKEDAESA